MEFWIPISIAAAFFQNIRSAIQKYLKDALSDTGATFVRFGFGFPLAIAYLAFLLYWFEEPLPQPNWRFSSFVLIGGATQILGTFLLVRLFFPAQLCRWNGLLKNRTPPSRGLRLHHPPRKLECSGLTRHRPLYVRRLPSLHRSKQTLARRPGERPGRPPGSHRIGFRSSIWHFRCRLPHRFALTRPHGLFDSGGFHPGLRHRLSDCDNDALLGLARTRATTPSGPKLAPLSLGRGRGHPRLNRMVHSHDDPKCRLRQSPRTDRTCVHLPRFHALLPRTCQPN